jgi:hypothetical protein
VRRERSSSKDEVAGSRTVEGVRDSLVMVHRRPRWLDEETRALKALCSSSEAWRESVGDSLKTREEIHTGDSGLHFRGRRTLPGLVTGW